MSARLAHTLLQKIALVVLAFRGFDLEVHSLRSVAELGENLLVLLGVEHLYGFLLAARNVEENIPQHHIEPRQTLDHRLDIVKVPARNDGVDLHGHLYFVASTNNFLRATVQARHLPTAVVEPGSRSMQPAGNSHQPACFEFGNDAGLQSWSRQQR